MTMQNNNILRSVRVTFDNGDVITTDMAASLSDADIKSYYAIGKVFNLGSADKDLLAKVQNVDILESVFAHTADSEAVENMPKYKQNSNILNDIEFQLYDVVDVLPGRQTSDQLEVGVDRDGSSYGTEFFFYKNVKADDNELNNLLKAAVDKIVTCVTPDHIQTKIEPIDGDNFKFIIIYTKPVNDALVRENNISLADYMFTFDKYCKENKEDQRVIMRALEFIEYLKKNKPQELNQWMLGNTSSTINLQALMKFVPGWKGFGDNTKEGLLNFSAFSLLDTVSLYNKSSWKFENVQTGYYVEDDYSYDFVLSDGRFLFLVEQDFGDMGGETNYYYRYFVSDTEDIKNATEIQYKEAISLLSPEDRIELQKVKNQLADGNAKRSRSFVERRVQESNADTIATELANEIQDLLSELDQELKETSEDIKEGVITTASIVIALPAILGIISRFGKYASTIVSKVLGKKPNGQSDYNKWMTQLGNVADQLHHLYITPIEKVVGKFFKDKHTAHAVANGIFHAMVAALLIASGVTAYKAFQAKNISLTTLESALTAIKSGELKTFFTDIISKG